MLPTRYVGEAAEYNNAQARIRCAVLMDGYELPGFT